MICFLPADVNENHLAAFRHSYALVTENHIRQINYLTTAVSNRKFQKSCRNDTSPLQGIDISICVNVRNPTIAARRIKHECGPHSTGKKSIDLVLTTDTKSMLFMFFLLSFFNHMFLPII